MTDTPTQKLASIILGRDVREWITQRRTKGVPGGSYPATSHEATNRQVDVTHESVRSWVTEDAVTALLTHQCRWSRDDCTEPRHCCCLCHRYPTTGRHDRSAASGAMDMTYWKATRPDGTDFHTGTVDYATALASGRVTAPVVGLDGHFPGPRLAAPMATVPTECVGMSWPCRLFEVEPIGDLDVDSSTRTRSDAHRCGFVREVDGHIALGPQGVEVAALIAHGCAPGDAGRATGRRLGRRRSGPLGRRDAARDAAGTPLGGRDAARGGRSPGTPLRTPLGTPLGAPLRTPLGTPLGAPPARRSGCRSGPPPGSGLLLRGPDRPVSRLGPGRLRPVDRAVA